MHTLGALSYFALPRPKATLDLILPALCRGVNRWRGDRERQAAKRAAYALGAIARDDLLEIDGFSLERAGPANNPAAMEKESRDHSRRSGASSVLPAGSSKSARLGTGGGVQ